MKEISTWGEKSKFSYSGSVKEGTKIVFRSGVVLKFSIEEYRKILNFFSGKIVNIGTSRTNPPNGSLGRWIELNLGKMGTTSFIGAILLNEGYAIKTKNRAEIKFF
jgi:hypothetical protein